MGILFKSRGDHVGCRNEFINYIALKNRARKIGFRSSSRRKKSFSVESGGLQCMVLEFKSRRGGHFECRNAFIYYIALKNR